MGDAKAALQRLYAPGQRLEHLADPLDFLRAHAAQSSPAHPLITMHLHCSFEG